MYYLGTAFDTAHFNALLTDTAYVQQSTEGKQKLLIGSYNFRPKSIPYTALAEMCARIPRLDRDKERLLEGIFNTKIKE